MNNTLPVFSHITIYIAEIKDIAISVCFQYCAALDKTSKRKQIWQHMQSIQIKCCKYRKLEPNTNAERQRFNYLVFSLSFQLYYLMRVKNKHVSYLQALVKGVHTKLIMLIRSLARYILVFHKHWVDTLRLEVCCADTELLETSSRHQAQERAHEILIMCISSWVGN